MDVRIGITDTAQVLEVELAEEADRAAVKEQLDKVLAGADSVLWLTDRKGKEVGVPASSVAFVELSADDSERRIGFGA